MASWSSPASREEGKATPNVPGSICHQQVCICGPSCWTTNLARLLYRSSTGRCRTATGIIPQTVQALCFCPQTVAEPFKTEHYISAVACAYTPKASKPRATGGQNLQSHPERQHRSIPKGSWICIIKTPRKQQKTRQLVGALNTTACLTKAHRMPEACLWVHPHLLSPSFNSDGLSNLPSAATWFHQPLCSPPCLSQPGPPIRSFSVSCIANTLASQSYLTTLRYAPAGLLCSFQLWFLFLSISSTS